MQSYELYGDVMYSSSYANSNYRYTGEWRDATGLTYLRARYLDTGMGRFITRDTWAGDYNRPLSLNRWMYVEGNPVNYTDPTGHYPIMDSPQTTNYTQNSHLGAYSNETIYATCPNFGHSSGDESCEITIGVGFIIVAIPIPCPWIEFQFQSQTHSTPTTTSTPQPQANQTPTPEPSPTPLPTPEFWPNILIHYTDEAGKNGILADKEIWVSDGTWGHGQYFTNVWPAVASSFTKNEWTLALYRNLDFAHKTDWAIAINVQGFEEKLSVPHPVHKAKGALLGGVIILHKSTNDLDVAGRILMVWKMEYSDN